MKNKKILGLLMFILIQINVISFQSVQSAQSDVDKKRDALIETAEAYLRKGASFQYDVYRENRFNSPEQATSQYTIYSVCSSFMNQTYHNTLPKIAMSYQSTNLIKYAREKYKVSTNYYDSSITTDNKASGKYILKYYDAAATTNALKNTTSLSTNWAQFLKKGDVFVVYFDKLKMGHTMIVKEVNGTNVTLIDNNGYVYNHEQYVDNRETKGSIGLISLQNRLNEYKGTVISEMAIIRYITDDDKYLTTSTASEHSSGALTSAAETRLLYPSMDIEKTSRVISEKNNNTSIFTANINDKIEYTITIKNNSSKDYTKLVINENIDNQFVRIVSYDGNPTVTSTQLTWKNITIPRGQTYKLKYIVQVNSNKNLLGKIINSTGKVGNGTYFIDNTNVYHYISSTLRTDQKDALSAYSNNLELYKNVTERAFINKLYSNILNVELGLDNLTNSQIISYCDRACEQALGTTLVVANTKINNTRVKDMILYNFYGLATVPAAEAYAQNQTVNAFDAWRYLSSKEVLNSINNRARTIKANMLEVGDIILLYDAVTLQEKDYIYIDENKLIRKVNESNFEILSGAALDTFLTNIVGNNYIILRPSLAMDSTIVKADNNLVLSSTSGSYTYPNGGTFTITNNLSGGTLSCSSSNTNVATCSIEGTKVTVTPGITAGNATITVTSAATTKYNAGTAVHTATINNGTLNITANGYTGSYDGKAHGISVSCAGATIKYSTSANGTYTTSSPTYKDAGIYTVYYEVSKAGYNTVRGSKQVVINKMNKKNNTLKLSIVAASYTYPNSGTFSVTKNTSGGALTCLSNNEAVVTCSISGNTVTVTPGTTSGTATVTIISAETTKYNAGTAVHTATINNGTLNITSNDYTGSYDGKAHGISVSCEGAIIKYGTTNGIYDLDINPTYIDAGEYTVYYEVSKEGYNTVRGSKQVVINKAENILTLSIGTANYIYPNIGTFTVTNNLSGGALTCSSSNEAVVTCAISGNTVTVNPGTTIGNTNVIVTSAETPNYMAGKVVHVASTQPSLLTITANGYTGVYDGLSHGVIVISEGATIKYGTQKGVYDLTVSPTYKDVGTYTVYYEVSKDGYATYIGEANIVITDENNDNQIDNNINFGQKENIVVYFIIGFVLIIICILLMRKIIERNIIN